MKLNWKDYTTYNPNNFTGWRAARETGYIYFIRCNQYIKIGKTSNLYQRVHSLQGSNPHELKLVGIYASASLTVDEKFFHNEVKKIANKIRGEWFVSNSDLVKYIDLITKHKMMLSLDEYNYRISMYPEDWIIDDEDIITESKPMNPHRNKNAPTIKNWLEYFEGVRVSK